MIVNELLCYTIFCFKANVHDNLKRVLINFYNDKEIIESKKVLWNAGQEILGEYHNRIGSNNRPAIAAHIEDILEGIKSLDIADKLPDVVARNLDRVPDRQPEELNLLFVIERLSKIEKNYKVQNDAMAAMALKMIDLQMDNDKLKSMLDSMSDFCARTFNEPKKTDMQEIITSEPEIIQDTASISDETQNSGDTSTNNTVTNIEQEPETSSYASAITNGVNHQNSSQNNTTPIEAIPPDNTQANAPPDNTQANALPIDNVAPITVPNEQPHINRGIGQLQGPVRNIEQGSSNHHGHQRNRGQSNSRRPSLQRQNSGRAIYDNQGYQMAMSRQQKRRVLGRVFGQRTAASGGLQGAPLPKTHIWVSHVVNSDINILNTFLRDNNITVHNSFKVSHEEANFNSFKICINVPDLEIVLNEQFWPDGIKCQKWRKRNDSDVFSDEIRRNAPTQNIM